MRGIVVVLLSHFVLCLLAWPFRTCPRPINILILVAQKMKITTISPLHLFEAKCDSILVQVLYGDEVPSLWFQYYETGSYGEKVDNKQRSSTRCRGIIGVASERRCKELCDTRAQHDVACCIAAVARPSLRRLGNASSSTAALAAFNVLFDTPGRLVLEISKTRICRDI